MRKKGKISICVNEEDEGVEIYIYIVMVQCCFQVKWLNCFCGILSL